MSRKILTKVRTNSPSFREAETGKSGQLRIIFNSATNQKGKSPKDIHNAA